MINCVISLPLLEVKNAIVGIKEPTARDSLAEETRMRDYSDNLFWPAVQICETELRTGEDGLLVEVVSRSGSGCLVRVNGVKMRIVDLGEFSS